MLGRWEYHPSPSEETSFMDDHLWDNNMKRAIDCKNSISLLKWPKYLERMGFVHDGAPGFELNLKWCSYDTIWMKEKCLARLSLELTNPDSQVKRYSNYTTGDLSFGAEKCLTWPIFSAPKMSQSPLLGLMDRGKTSPLIFFTKCFKVLT